MKKAVVVAPSTKIVYQFLQKVKYLLAESPSRFPMIRLLQHQDKHLEMSLFQKATIKGRQAADVRRETILPIVITLRNRHHQKMVFPTAVTVAPVPKEKFFRLIVIMAKNVSTADLVPVEMSFRPVAMVDEAVKAGARALPETQVVVVPSIRNNRVWYLLLRLAIQQACNVVACTRCQESLQVTFPSKTR
jgi:hypothetical protein